LAGGEMLRQNVSIGPERYQGSRKPDRWRFSRATRDQNIWSVGEIGIDGSSSHEVQGA
jgi:hypothetical protein